MTDLNMLSHEQLDIVWAALVSYRREMTKRGDKEEADKAEALGDTFYARRNEVK